MQIITILVILKYIVILLLFSLAKFILVKSNVWWVNLILFSPPQVILYRDRCLLMIIFIPLVWCWPKYIWTRSCLLSSNGELFKIPDFCFRNIKQGACSINNVLISCNWKIRNNTLNVTAGYPTAGDLVMDRYRKEVGFLSLQTHSFKKYLTSINFCMRYCEAKLKWMSSSVDSNSVYFTLDEWMSHLWNGYQSKSGKNTFCLHETQHLDGETRLKLKK